MPTPNQPSLLGKPTKVGRKNSKFGSNPIKSRLGVRSTVQSQVLSVGPHFIVQPLATDSFASFCPSSVQHPSRLFSTLSFPRRQSHIPLTSLANGSALSSAVLHFISGVLCQGSAWFYSGVPSLFSIDQHPTTIKPSPPGPNPTATQRAQTPSPRLLPHNKAP